MTLFFVICADKYFESIYIFFDICYLTIRYLFLEFITFFLLVYIKLILKHAMQLIRIGYYITLLYPAIDILHLMLYLEKNFVEYSFDNI